jgi:uncharacterized protein YdaU (DUF1376 family)
MQLYVSDFLGDTMHLSTEQIGGYMLLLMAMWNAGGVLPNDDTKLARIARMSSRKWSDGREELLKFFEVSEASVTHRRVTKELEKVARISELRRQKGAMGGAAKSLKYNAQGLAKASHLLDNHNHIEKKEVFNGLSPTEKPEQYRLDRIHDEDIFKECERLMGKDVPKWKQTAFFPSDIILMAKEATKK